MGALGLLLGPLLLGLSRLVGLVLGVVSAAVLIRSDGATGAWAREMGAQVSQLKVWLLSEAETRKLPDLARSARAKAKALWASAATEIASFDEAAGLSQRA